MKEMASKEIGLQDENNSDVPPDKPKDQMKKFMRQVGDVYAPWDVPAFSGLLAPLRGVLGQLAYRVYVLTLKRKSRVKARC